MDKYRFPQQEQAALERLQQPFAVYQFIDRRVVTLLLSEGFCRLFGYADRDQAVNDMNHDMYRDTHPDDKARAAEAAVRFATEGGDYDVVYRTRIPGSGQYRVVHAHGVHVYTDNGTRLAQVWYTDEGAYALEGSTAGTGLNKALNDALREQSFLKASRFDYLTGLPNMTYFFELAEAARKQMEQDGTIAAMLYIDLNGMKFFNHKYGFAAGDEYLQAFARLLVSLFGSENCSRLGQDHFAAFAPAEGAEDTLKALFDGSRELNSGNTLTVRVGIFTNAEENVSASAACDRAKLACETLRNVYDSAFCYYSGKLREDAVQKRYILDSFDRALKEKWIRAYYQPIVRAVNERVCDEEALARWIDPEKGFMSPAEFIPCLEEAGQLYRLDLYILEQVLEKIGLQKEAGLHVLPHSINLSRSDFEACDIAEEIRKRVDAAGIGRDMITIEITESVIGSDFEFMKEQVERFRSMGFPVWMDDFGSGYSALDVLQSIHFDLIKFDMSFMRRLDEGESGKIILTELMKMATSLGVDTVCEGVETAEQVRFLQEIGCSKLQGYYFCKPIPVEEIFERYRKGIQIGFEDPKASAYYEAVGRVNLYDLGVIAGEDGESFVNAFNTLPMGIIEIQGNGARFVRSNPSYREFIRRYFGHEISGMGREYNQFRAGFMSSIAKSCSEQGSRAFYDERMPDGTRVHSFARRIGVHPQTGAVAVAVAVLSITEPGSGVKYAEIARALAADYFNIYMVELNEKEDFIEYTSPVGMDELAEKRRGTGFFETARQDVLTKIYAEDREMILRMCTRENIIRELEQHGVFTMTYRLIQSGKPVYVNMKANLLQDRNRMIMGVSLVDAQMREQQQIEEIRKERNMLAKIMALSGDYMSLYSIHPETGQYVEYTASEEYETLGISKEGAKFFEESIRNIRASICPEDLPLFLEKFTRENIRKDIREKGAFTLQYRLMVRGEAKRVILKIAPVRDGDETKLIAGLRIWRNRS